MPDLPVKRFAAAQAVVFSKHTRVRDPLALKVRRNNLAVRSRVTVEVLTELQSLRRPGGKRDLSVFRDVNAAEPACLLPGRRVDRVERVARNEPCLWPDAETMESPNGEAIVVGHEGHTFVEKRCSHRR